MSEHTQRKTQKHTHTNTRVLKNTHHTRTLTFAATRSLPSTHSTNFDIALTRAHVRTDIYTHTQTHALKSHICKSLVTHRNESKHTRMRHVAYVVESCNTYEKVMSRIGMRLGAHMNKSCHTYELVLTRREEANFKKKKTNLYTHSCVT